MKVNSCLVSFSIDGVERWHVKEIHSREEALGAALRLTAKGMFKHISLELIAEVTRDIIAKFGVFGSNAEGAFTWEWELVDPDDENKLFVLDIEYDWENC